MKTQVILTLAIFMALPAFGQRYQYKSSKVAQNQYQNEAYGNEAEQQEDVQTNYGSGYNRYGKPRANVKTVKTGKRIKTAARYYNPRVAQQRAAEAQMSTTEVAQWNDGAEYLNRAYIDLAPLFNQGISVAYERVLFSKVAVGAYGSFYKMENEKSKATGAKNDITAFGARARYFINGNADESAFYVMGAAQYSMLKTEVDANKEFKKQLQDQGQYVNPWIYNQERKMSRETGEFGGVVGAGYQIAANAFGSSAMIVDIGGFYGHGNQVKYEVKNINNGIQTELTSELGYGFFGELSVGIAF